MIKKPISADSHITEPPNTYIDYIDPKYRERAPKMVELEGLGDAFVIEGMQTPVPYGLLAAAGKDPKDITTGGVKFKDIWRSGWDAKYRVADQEKDGRRRATTSAPTSRGRDRTQRGTPPTTWTADPGIRCPTSPPTVRDDRHGLRSNRARFQRIDGEAAKWGMLRDTFGGYSQPQLALVPGCDRSMRRAYGRSSVDSHRPAGWRPVSE